MIAAGKSREKFSQRRFMLYINQNFVYANNYFLIYIVTEDKWCIKWMKNEKMIFAYQFNKKYLDKLIKFFLQHK